MNSNSLKKSAVPVNIITGYLGVGKSTAILSLLEQKPVDERWAILVNEFGEVGIDGSVYREQHSELSGVFVREVTGGCMCCTAGLSMQFALSQVLSKAKPHRLLIEPTGLGHPVEVLQILAQPHYQEILNIQRTITLVDARLASRSNQKFDEVFNEQIDLADVLVANKSDLYEPEDLGNFENYLKQRNKDQIVVVATQFGLIDIELLHGPSGVAKQIETGSLRGIPETKKMKASEVKALEVPECGFGQFENQAGEFSSVGWVFAPDKVLNRKAVFSWLSGINVERAKAVCITQEGVFAYSLSESVLTEFELDDCSDSRIEIIYHSNQKRPSGNPAQFLL